MLFVVFIFFHFQSFGDFNLNANVQDTMTYLIPSGSPLDGSYIRVSSHLPGSPISVRVDTTGNRLFVGLYGGLLMYEGPPTFRPISYALDGHVFDMEMRGDFLIAAVGGYGLTIYDASGDTLVEVARYADIDLPLDVEFAGDYLYLASGDGFFIFEASALPSLQLLSGVSFDGYPVSVRIRDTFAFLLEGDTIHVLSVARADSPYVISRYGLGGDGRSLELKENLLAVAEGYGGFELLDVSNPASIQPLSSIWFSGIITSSVIVDTFLIVSNLFSETRVYGISNPQEPRFLYSTFTPFVSSHPAGDYLYCADRFHGIVWVHDMSNLPYLTLEFYLTVPGGVRSLELVGDYLYTGSNFEGILIFDRSLSPWPVKSYLYFVPVQLKKYGDYLYALRWDQLSIYNVSVPDSLSPVSTIFIGVMQRDMDVEDSLIVTIGYSDSTLRVFDVSNPEYPVPEDSVKVGIFPFRVEMDYPRIYVNGTGGIRIYDVSNPGNVSLIGSYPVEYAGSIYTMDSMALVYLSDGASQLCLMDVSDPSNLQQINCISASGIVDMEVVDSLVIAIGANGYVFLYGIRDTALYFIDQAGWYPYSTFWEMRVDFPDIYVAADRMGVVKFTVESVNMEETVDVAGAIVKREIHLPAGMHYSLFDMGGRVVKSGISSGRISLRELPSGMYILKAGRHRWKVLLR